MSAIVINESFFTNAKRQEQGVSEGVVYNGDWAIVIDWDNNIFWSKRHPDNKVPIKSVRPGISGECFPYF